MDQVPSSLQRAIIKKRKQHAMNGELETEFILKLPWPMTSRDVTNLLTFAGGQEQDAYVMLTVSLANAQGSSASSHRLRLKTDKQINAFLSNTATKLMCSSHVHVKKRIGPMCDIFDGIYRFRAATEEHVTLYEDTDQFLTRIMDPTVRKTYRLVKRYTVKKKKGMQLDISVTKQVTTFSCNGEILKDVPETFECELEVEPGIFEDDATVQKSISKYLEQLVRVIVSPNQVCDSIPINVLGSATEAAICEYGALMLQPGMMTERIVAKVRPVWNDFRASTSKTVANLMYDLVPLFFAPNVSTLDKVTLKRIVAQQRQVATVKLDGDRGLLFFPTNFTKTGLAFCILRAACVGRRFLKFVPLRIPLDNVDTAVFESACAVLDGELLQGTFYAFDMPIVFGSNKMSTKPFSERYQTMQRALLATTESTVPSPLQCKTFHEFPRELPVLGREIAAFGEHQDGLIVQAWDGIQSMYQMNGKTWWTAYKWKDRRHSTVDFHVGDDGIALYASRGVVGLTEVAKLDRKSTHLCGAIVECSYNVTNDTWSYVRTRSEKVRPNSIFVYQFTKLVACSDIATFEGLLREVAIAPHTTPGTQSLKANRKESTRHITDALVTLLMSRQQRRDDEKEVRIRILDLGSGGLKSFMCVINALRQYDYHHRNAKEVVVEYVSTDILPLGTLQQTVAMADELVKKYSCRHKVFYSVQYLDFTKPVDNSIVDSDSVDMAICTFAIHYALETRATFEQFACNLQTVLKKPHGVVVGTYMSYAALRAGGVYESCVDNGQLWRVRDKHPSFFSTFGHELVVHVEGLYNNQERVEYATDLDSPETQRILCECSSLSVETQPTRLTTTVSSTDDVDDAQRWFSLHRHFTMKRKLRLRFRHLRLRCKNDDESHY